MRAEVISAVAAASNRDSKLSSGFYFSNIISLVWIHKNMKGCPFISLSIAIGQLARTGTARTYARTHRCAPPGCPFESVTMIKRLKNQFRWEMLGPYFISDPQKISSPIYICVYIYTFFLTLISILKYPTRIHSRSQTRGWGGAELPARPRRRLEGVGRPRDVNESF